MFVVSSGGADVPAGVLLEIPVVGVEGGLFAVVVGQFEGDSLGTELHPVSIIMTHQTTHSC